jgi:Zn finger protein HypA/HybF involved in hydrogenase expression
MLKLPIIFFIGNLYIFALVLKSNISSINELTLKQKIIGQCNFKHIMMSSVWRQAHYDVVSVTSNTWCRQCDVKHIMMSSVWRQAHYDVVSVTSNTLWCHQCDVKHIMMSLIKTITPVLNVSTYIITSITALPIRLAEILVTMYVLTFKTAVIILYIPELWSWDIPCCDFKICHICDKLGIPNSWSWHILGWWYWEFFR